MDGVNHALQVNVVAGGGAGGTASTFGAAFPGTGTAVGFKDSTGTNMVPGNLDASGNLKIAGSFSSTPPTSSTANAPAQTTVGTVAGSILASNGAAKGRRVKNTGTTVIKLGLGTNPTQTAYHVDLSACGVANDGSGGYWDGTMGGCLYTGAIDAISSAAGGTCVVTELT